MTHAVPGQPFPFTDHPLGFAGIRRGHDPPVAFPPRAVNSTHGALLARGFP